LGANGALSIFSAKPHLGSKKETLIDGIQRRAAKASRDGLHLPKFQKDENREYT
jgi:hypothetical protein